MLLRLSLLSGLLLLAQASFGQNLVTDDTAEWYTLGGDYAHTRYTPADEISADNFEDLLFCIYDIEALIPAKQELVSEIAFEAKLVAAFYV